MDQDTQHTTTNTTATLGDLLPYVYSDGGRAKYFKGKVGVTDCVCRAVAIASGRDYKDVYTALKEATGESPRKGIYTNRAKFKRFMLAAGFTWTPCSRIGDTTAVHPRQGEIPTSGRLVCSASGHYFAVVDGIVYDAWDSRFNSYGQVRRIYGYWTYNN